MPRILIPIFTILLCVVVGCAEKDRQLNAWQQQQVDHTQHQAEQNTLAAKALVEADAQARRDLTESQRAAIGGCLATYSATPGDSKALW